MDIRDPELHFKGHERTVKDVKFDAPSITGKISMPDVDLNLKDKK